MEPEALERRMGIGARRLRLEAGETLFLRGDRPWAMFGVLDGTLRLSRSAFDGTPLTLHVAERGTFLAEASLYAEVYHCDCAASVPSTVLAFARVPLLALLREDAGVAEHFFRMMARQVQSLRAQVEIRNIKGAADRLMAALVLRAPEDRAPFAPAETWKAFAAQIGLTHEALYRALRRLEDQGALSREGRCVRLVDPQGHW